MNVMEYKPSCGWKKAQDRAEKMSMVVDVIGLAIIGALILVSGVV